MSTFVRFYNASIFRNHRPVLNLLAHPIHILYNLGIALYGAGIRIAAITNQKARQMVEGWARTWNTEPLKGEKVAWFHASSLGEFEQARPVIKKFRDEHPDFKVWVTFFSPSGYEVRKNCEEAERVTYLPIDTPRNARRLVELINPEVAFFVKYDFWFNMLRELNRRGVKTFIFSAIFRKSHYFFKPYGGWFRKQLRCFDHIFVQNEESLRLLKDGGVDWCSVAGDTRFDRVKEIAERSEGDMTVERFLAGNSGKCIVAGSSWEPDEENLKAYLDSCQGTVRLVLAPHVISESHLERIENLFGKMRCIRYSKACKEQFPTENERYANILIIDNIGLLSRIYRYADVAYIGGGFGRGIHNILEALTYEVPVVFGPNHTKFQEAKDILRLGGGFTYHNPESLAEVMDRLLSDDHYRQEASQVCKKYVESNIGSTAKIMTTLNLEL